MGYELPASVPAWRVQVFADPWCRGRWQESVSKPTKVFRTEKAALQYCANVAGDAAWSLMPIAWEGRIERVVRQPDWRDRFRATFNMRPFCGSLHDLYADTHP